ncbi:MAG: PEGA domain-containing protein [Candidatus Omnitrophica bacterium]|nr:PEGA domain-containing protein [Candidatus Omnitrophota bacterium]
MGKMHTFQRIRGFLFYISVFLFIAGLPFILSFALGYKFNLRNFKFVKTGLIYIKTQPEGAKVYLNNKMIAQRTPVSIQELIPGPYKVILELAQHYSWKGEISVEEGKVSRMDKIILFPLKPNLEQLNQEKFSSFRLDAQKEAVYYLDPEERVVYKSDLDGGNFKDIASIPVNLADIKGWDVALDRSKLFMFSNQQIIVISFDAKNSYVYSDSPVIIDYSREKIIQVFWHSDSYHLVVVTNKHVAVIEARAAAEPINLVGLEKEIKLSFYDEKRDTLYFSDIQKNMISGDLGSNLYRLELNTDLFVLESLMQRKQDE